jgi:putative hydrolase of the HAD superfamily
MIKAVIFDFGGVILRTHNWNGRRAWEARLNLEPNQLEAIVFNSENGRQAQHGHITYTDHWRWLQTHFALTDSQIQQLEHDFWAGDQLDWEMVASIRRLRQTHQTGLISNAFDDLRHTLTHQFAIADAFDAIVISAEEHIMKPHPQLYQTALTRLGCQPHEALFIDDFPHNIAGAQAVGMVGIHYTPQTDLVTTLVPLGIPWT